MARRKRRIRKRVVKLVLRINERRGDITAAESAEIFSKYEELDGLDFLEWLMENWEEILEMILAILILF